MEEKVERKTSERKRYLYLLIPVVIILIAVIGGTFYYKSRPKVILKESYKYLTKGLKQDSSNGKTPLQEKLEENSRIKLESDIQLKINKELGIGVNEVSLKLDAKTDKEKEIAHYQIASKIDNEDLLSLEMYLKDNKFYMTIKNIMDKYYFQELEQFHFKEKDGEDVDRVMEAIGKSIKNVVTDSKFQKTTEKITIDKEEMKATKLSLNITDTLLGKMIKEFTKQVRDDNDIRDSFINVTGIKEEELEQILDQLENEMENTQDETLLNYHIYYTGTDHIQMLELENDGDSLTYTANENYHIQYKSQGELVFDLIITEENGREAKLGTITILGTYKEDEKTKLATLKFKDGNSDIAELTLKIEEQSTTENTVNLEIKSEDTIIASMTATNRYTFGEEINIENLENAKSLEDMTQEELEQMQRKLEIHPLIGPLFQMFNSLFAEEEPELTEEEFSFEDFEESPDSEWDYKIEYLH